MMNRSRLYSFLALLTIGLVLVAKFHRDTNRVPAPRQGSSSIEVLRPASHDSPLNPGIAAKADVSNRTTQLLPGSPMQASRPAPASGQPDVNRIAAAQAPNMPPLVRNVEEPKAGSRQLVPGHFDGIMVSYEPLAEPPRPVKPGTPRNPPTVIHNPPEKGGGTTYVLDATWDTPDFVPGSVATANATSAPEKNPPVSAPNK